MSKILESIKGVVSQPDQEIFKIGPDVIQDFIGKIIITMGGTPDDIENVQVGQDKKRLRILAMINKDSDIFACEEDNRKVHGGLTLMGAAEVQENTELTPIARTILEEIGYSYTDDDDRKVLMITITEYKKGIEIEFNTEVTMAIITDSDFSDRYFIVDAAEEVFKKKKHDSHKFKDKKKMIVFAKVQRSALGNQQGFDPDQVSDWKSNSDDDEGDDC
jgi:hypothetical protein